jgi:MFS family permease
MLIAPLADIFGRRRLLLITVFGESIFTIASAFTNTYPQFVTLQILARVFGYAEEMLCFVVIVEEMDARVRGWASGTLGAMGATGAGIAALIFAAVNVLPFGWRSMYLIGGSALFVLAYFRRKLPETERFEIYSKEIAKIGSKSAAALNTLGLLFWEYPGRLTAMVLSVGIFFFAIGPAIALTSKYVQQTLHYTPFHVMILFVGGGLVSVIGNIVAGRLSDRVGRKRVLLFSATVCGAAFVALYVGNLGAWVPAAWIFGVFGYFTCDTLMAGYTVEMFPTAYRATAGTLRYVVATLTSALALALEGIFYDHFGAHGPAIVIFIAAMPLALIAILFLPETSQKKLEEISHGEDGVVVAEEQST